MKIWFKILISSIIGIALGIFLPGKGNWVTDIFTFLSTLFIHIGRYTLFPLVFFMLASGTYELMKTKSLLKVYSKSVMYLLATTAFIIAIGTLTIVIFFPGKIPIILEKETAASFPGIDQILLNLFPLNMFNVFTNNGDFLLPVCFLAVLFGLNFSFEKNITRNLTHFFDSMSHLLYHINSLFLELVSFGFIAITAALLVNIRTINYIDQLLPSLLIIGIDILLIIFVVFPLILFLSGEKTNPYKLLYGMLGPALSALLTGDSYFSLNMLIKHGKENLGIPRQQGSATYPLFALFGRSGTALVTSISFIIILKSISNLDLSIGQVFWVMGFSFLISFALGAVPGSGAFAALALLSAFYGKGLEEGYLALKPISLILINLGVLLDVITSAFVSTLVAMKLEIRENIDPKRFI